MTIALILFALVALLLTGVPIFAGLGLASVVLMLLTEGSIGSAADTVFGKLDTGLLSAIPLFAFMAHIMIRARVMDDLFATAHTLVRHLPGGLGVATVLSCTIFAAISGSSVATALTVGTSAIPQMKKFGYRARDAYGVVAAGGTLGILIPPSGPLILYAIVTETSIGARSSAAPTTRLPSPCPTRWPKRRNARSTRTPCTPASPPPAPRSTTCAPANRRRNRSSGVTADTPASPSKLLK